MQDENGYTLRLADSIQDLQTTNDIRYQVFVMEQGYPVGAANDDYDTIAAHLVLASTDNPSDVVGTIRFLPYPLPKLDLASVEGAKKTSPLGNIPQTSALLDCFLQHQSLKKSIDKILNRENNGVDAESGIIKIKFGRVAITKTQRGKKLGEKMLLDSERWLTKLLKDEIELQGLDMKGVEFRASSQSSVVDFYRRLGYETEGDIYKDTGTPHRLVKKLVLF